LLGRKVSIRYRLHDDPDHPFSEAIGVVMAVTEGDVSILNRKGTVAVVPINDILATKIM
jgi:hypothetical protein